MGTLSGSARSLVNVHAAAGVRVQAVCAGWPGGYRVKPGGEPCLQDSGGGGGEGVIVGGDEVQQGPWSVQGCRAAVRARAWYALVILSDWWYVCLPRVLFGDGPGGMVPLDSAGSVFVAVGCEQQDGVWCPAFV